MPNLPAQTRLSLPTSGEYFTNMYVSHFLTCGNIWYKSGHFNNYVYICTFHIGVLYNNDVALDLLYTCQYFASWIRPLAYNTRWPCNGIVSQLFPPKPIVFIYQRKYPQAYYVSLTKNLKTFDTGSQLPDICTKLLQTYRYLYCSPKILRKGIPAALPNPARTIIT